jgi:hypothetical protein
VRASAATTAVLVSLLLFIVVVVDGLDVLALDSLSFCMVSTPMIGVAVALFFRQSFGWLAVTTIWLLAALYPSLVIAMTHWDEPWPWFANMFLAALLLAVVFVPVLCPCPHFRYDARIECVTADTDPKVGESFAVHTFQDNG